MKNVTKAAIAGGIGVALLLGGAGTVAFWTDSADGGDGIISAGTLDIGTVAGGGWEISHAGSGAGEPTAAEAFDPAADQIVPGDILTYTQSIPVELQGENIAAIFNGDISITPTSEAEADTALADAITAEDLAATELTGADGLTLEGDTLTGEGTGSVEVTTTITFPWGEESEFNAAKLGSLDFAVDYTLTQAPNN
ncbi:MAG: alternate-type signal peptide domain-containing protein [Brevibacterium yomogidense]|uniref:alternate-type signal peptide domain-containing protein n=1 Tax=Brevibacterium TaxID=1696 RepID=UPI000C4E9D3F|nr:alternate-type signal peptide domain-containing protein [Brevibacterium sp. Mu109]SMX93618.1 alternate signal-mediated exported protein, RER_14450 family [Brevibacterium sp. Mu109]